MTADRNSPAGPSATPLPGEEQRLRLVIEAAPNAMVMVDRRGLITLVNTQTEKLFAYNRAQMLGQPVEMLIPQRFRGVALCDSAASAALPWRCFVRCTRGLQ